MNYDRTQEIRSSYDKFCNLAIGWITETLLFEHFFTNFKNLKLQYNGQVINQNNYHSSKCDFIDNKKNISIEVTSYKSFNSNWFPCREPKFNHILREREIKFFYSKFRYQ